MRRTDPTSRPDPVDSDLRDLIDRAVERIRGSRTPRGDSLGVHCVTVTSGHQRFERRLARPDGERAPDGPVDVRSLSKVALSLAVGVAIDRGEQLGGYPITLNSPVWPVFEQIPAIAAVDKSTAWREVTVGHLLGGTTGHRTGFLFRRDLAGRDPARVLDYLFAAPLDHPPGTHFAYSNVGPFLLSVLVQETTGRRLAEWAGERLFGPLGMATPDWTRLGPYDAGATGLRLDAKGLHRIADLLRLGGLGLGGRVVSARWCDRMTSVVVPTPDRYDPADPLPQLGYGYGVWVTGDGRFFGSGTGGQYLVVVPGQDRAVTVLADEPDLTAIRRCLAPLFR